MRTKIIDKVAQLIYLKSCILNKYKGPNGIHQTKAMMLKKIAGTQNQ